MNDVANDFAKRVVSVSLFALAAFVPAAWWISGLEGVIGSVGGAGLGLANVVAMVWLVKRLVFGNGGARSKGLLSTLLMMKMALLVGVAWLGIRVLELDVLGFVLGFSAVVLGLLVSGVLTALDGPGWTEE